MLSDTCIYVDTYLADPLHSSPWHGLQLLTSDGKDSETADEICGQEITKRMRWQRKMAVYAAVENDSGYSSMEY